MRQYLKVDEKWKDWENMDMQWIHHHNPDLVVLDDRGKEKERIDLQGLTAAKLESLCVRGESNPRAPLLRASRLAHGLPPSSLLGKRSLEAKGFKRR